MLMILEALGLCLGEGFLAGRVMPLLGKLLGKRLPLGMLPKLLMMMMVLRT